MTHTIQDITQKLIIHYQPVNVLLSLGYTLLANAVQTQVQVAGLDPYLGCLHSPEYGRPSLVLDLMEKFRSVLVDALVLYLVNRRIIRCRRKAELRVTRGRGSPLCWG